MSQTKQSILKKECCEINQRRGIFTEELAENLKPRSYGNTEAERQVFDE